MEALLQGKQKQNREVRLFCVKVSMQGQALVEGARFVSCRHLQPQTAARDLDTIHTSISAS